MLLKILPVGRADVELVHPGLGWKTRGMSVAPKFVSVVRADSQVRLIFKVLAGIMVLVAVLMAFAGGQEDLRGNLLGTGVALAAALGIYLLPLTMTTRTEITGDGIDVSCMKVFRATLRLDEVQHVFDDPSLFTGGYGLRLVAKGHRAFVSGGPQVTIAMRDGRRYTVSVESSGEFLAAYAQVAASKP